MFEPLYKLFSMERKSVDFELAQNICLYVSQEIRSEKSDILLIAHCFRILTRTSMLCCDSQANDVVIANIVDLMLSQDNEAKSFVYTEFLLIYKALSVFMKCFMEFKNVDDLSRAISLSCLDLPISDSVQGIFPKKLSLPFNLQDFSNLVCSWVSLSSSLIARRGMCDFNNITDFVSISIDFLGSYVPSIPFSIKILAKIQDLVISCNGTNIFNSLVSYNQVLKIVEWVRKMIESFVSEPERHVEGNSLFDLVTVYNIQECLSLIISLIEKCETEDLFRVFVPLIDEIVIPQFLPLAKNYLNGHSVIKIDERGLSCLEAVITKLLNIMKYLSSSEKNFDLIEIGRSICTPATFQSYLGLYRAYIKSSKDIQFSFINWSQSSESFIDSSSKKQRRLPSQPNYSDNVATTISNSPNRLDFNANSNDDAKSNQCLGSIFFEIENIFASADKSVQESLHSKDSTITNIVYLSLMFIGIFDSMFLKDSVSTPTQTQNNESDMKSPKKRSIEPSFSNAQHLAQVYSHLIKRCLLSIKSNLNAHRRAGISNLCTVLFCLKETINAFQDIISTESCDIVCFDEIVVFLINQQFVDVVGGLCLDPSNSPGALLASVECFRDLHPIIPSSCSAESCFLILAELLCFPSYSVRGDGGVYYLKFSVALTKSVNKSRHPYLISKLSEKICDRLSKLSKNNFASSLSLTEHLEVVVSMGKQVIDAPDFMVPFINNILLSSIKVFGIPDFKISNLMEELKSKMRMVSISNVSATYLQSYFGICLGTDLSSEVAKIHFDYMIGKWAEISETKVESSQINRHVSPASSLVSGLRDIVHASVSVIKEAFSRSKQNPVAKQIFDLFRTTKCSLCINNIRDIRVFSDSKTFDSINSELDEILFEYLKQCNNVSDAGDLLTLTLVARASRNTASHGECKSFGQLEQLLLSDGIYCSPSLNHAFVVHSFSTVAISCSLFQPYLSFRIISLLMTTWCRNISSTDPLIIHKTATIFNEFEFIAQSGALQYLVSTYPDMFSDVVIIPLLKSENKNKSVDRIPDLLRELLTFVSLIPTSSMVDGTSNEEVSIRSLIEGVIIPTVVFMPASLCNLALERLHSAVPSIFSALASVPLSEKFSFLHKVFMKAEFQTYGVKSLVQGTMLQLMTHFSKSFNCSLFSEGDSTLHPFIITKTLIPLLWDLGADDEKYDQAVKALQVFCTLGRAKVWSVPESIVNSKSGSKQSENSTNCFFEEDNVTVEFDQDKNVTFVVAEYFLYVISKSIQNQWPSKSFQEQAHCIRLLGRMIKFLDQSDVTKYFPKITILLNLSFSSLSPLVQDTGIELFYLLLDKLPRDAFLKQLPFITVSFFDILDRLDKSNGPNELTDNLTAIPPRDFNGSLKWYSDRDQQPKSPLRDQITSMKFSSGSLNFFEFIFGPQLLMKYSEKIRGKVIVLLRKIFIHDRIVDISTVAHVPRIKGLEELVSMHVEAMSHLSLRESIAMHRELLKHESSNVREKAVILLGDIIHKNIEKLYTISVESSARHSGDQTTNLVSELMGDLLALSSRETEHNVIVALGACLGNLGAVDPSRILVSISVNNNNIAMSSDPPWKKKVEEVGLHLLETFLVPTLTSDPYTQDRTGYAIQSILKALAKSFPDRHYGQNLQKSSLLMSDEMKAMLKLKPNLYEAVEPYWHTKYQYLNYQPNQQPPFYRPGLSFSKWLGDFVPWLISCCKSPLTDLYYSCRGTLIRRVDISKYLLPRLILDAILTNYDAKTNEANGDMGIFNMIIMEIVSVLKGDCVNSSNSRSSTISQVQSEENHLCIQALFNTIDCLSLWVAQTSTPSRKSNPGLSKASLRVKPSCSLHSSNLMEIFTTPKQVADTHQGFYINATAAIHALLNAIPSDILVEAACNIKAYARALRILELDIKLRNLSEFVQSKPAHNSVSEQNSSKQNVEIKLSEERNDGSNRSLPRLNLTNLNDMLKIYSRLEGRDSVHGMLILKQLHGYEKTVSDRILEMEENENWIDALKEYGQALIADQRQDLKESNELSCVHDRIELERGRLRCLVEIGQLNAVIDQAIGIQTQRDFSAALLPIGAEAAWKLSHWDQLDIFCKSAEDVKEGKEYVTLDDEFNLCIGKGLLQIHKGNIQAFSKIIIDYRKKIMGSLAAASMESYNRCYPLLEKLQVLVDLEKSAHLSNEIRESNEKFSRSFSQSVVEERVRSFQWNCKLNMMSTSPRRRTTSYALHQTLLLHFNMNGDLARYLFSVSDYFRSIRNYEASLYAIRQAKLHGLDTSIVDLQECKLLHESGQPGKALMLIEPIDINVSAIKVALKKSKSGYALPHFLATESLRRQLAERVLLATQILIENKQQLGRRIASRFKCAIDLCDGAWDQAHYEFAKYNDESYSTQTTLSDSRPLSSNSSGSVHDSNGFSAADVSKSKFLVSAVEHYLRCVAVSSRYVLQALPRCITLWLSFTAIRDNHSLQSTQKLSSKVPSNNSAQSLNTSSEILKIYQDKCIDHLKSFSHKITPSTWYTCLPQLISRTGHTHAESLRIITGIIITVVTEFPHQSIWHMAGLAQSNNAGRVKIASDIINSVGKKLSDKASKVMLNECLFLFRSLITLAAFQTNEKKITYNLPSEIKHISQILVPTQAVLHNPMARIDNSSSTQFTASDRMYFQSIDEIVDVANSKAKPKTIVVNTVCGKRIKFLVKQEKQGDLRKDARLMEFNSIVNRLLNSSHEGRLRKLRLRTYAVICLTEECGILEWVNDTTCIRQVIAEAQSYWPDGIFPQADVKAIYTEFQGIQKQNECNIGELVMKYRRDVVDKYKPCLSRWFLEHFRDPTEWYDTRVMFARSVAVWSAIGYVIGLGDRHTENILVDIKNGECVHVDFDCLFDKGLTLPRPELVPFRLTPNFVEAMGLTGIEGHFRRSMEVSMTQLRENRETLMSVLEPFLRDPTVAWLRSGRTAQQRSGSSDSVDNKTLGYQDNENAEAKETLRKISARLRGVYNISHPFADRIYKAYQARGDTPPEFGLGSFREECLPLSVVGQVQRLIAEAISEENLAQMYVGWQPWL